MSSVIGHEGAHWGSNIKNAGFLSILNKFCNPIDGVSEHGKAFEARMYILNLGPSVNEKPRWGIDSGNYGSNISDYLKYYVKKNQKILSNIYK
ncbi:hypothetical protein [Chryseobacterium lineare]